MPTVVPPTTSWIFCTPLCRRSDMVIIGREPAPGALVCMMWVKLVVAFSELGMNMEWVSFHVSPLSRRRVPPSATIPLTSWRCLSVMVSRSTRCMVKR